MEELERRRDRNREDGAVRTHGNYPNDDDRVVDEGSMGYPWQAYSYQDDYLDIMHQRRQELRSMDMTADARLRQEWLALVEACTACETKRTKKNVTDMALAANAAEVFMNYCQLHVFRPVIVPYRTISTTTVKTG